MTVSAIAMKEASPRPTFNNSKFNGCSPASVYSGLRVKYLGVEGWGNILSVTAIAINPGSIAGARNSTLETFRKVCPLLAED